ADLAEDHEGGGAVAEALMDVRAAGCLADRRQVVLAQLGLELLHRIARGDAHADPAGLAQYRRVRVELDRAAGDLVGRHLLLALGQGRTQHLQRAGLGGVGHGGAQEERSGGSGENRACRPSWRDRAATRTGLTTDGSAGPPKSSTEVTSKPR